MKNLGTISILLLFCGCRHSSTESQIVFVDSEGTFANSTSLERKDPLLIVVEIDPDGKLTLNHIDVGTTADIAPIRQKLEVIFEDRSRVGIERKEIVIKMNGNVSRRDFEKLVEGLAGVSSSPIRVIKGGL